MKRFLNLQRILDSREMSNPIKAFMQKNIHPLWDKLPNWVQIVVCVSIVFGGIVHLKQCNLEVEKSRGPLKPEHRW